MKTPGILVLDLGSPTTSQVARCLRQLGVYAEVHPGDADLPHLATLEPRGVILSGGSPLPFGAEPPVPRRAVLDAGLPVLALGDGMLLIAARLRGRLRPGPEPSFEVERVGILRQSPLFETLLNEGRFATWMRTGVLLDDEPPGFVVTAKGDHGGVAAMEHLSKRLFALRFHPEHAATDHGLQMLANFAHDICECSGAWDLLDHVKMQQVSLRSQVGSARVACLLDHHPASLVVAALAARATGGALVSAVLHDDDGAASERGQALRAFARDVLGHEAVVVPASALPARADAQLDGLARLLEASFVIVPPGRATQTHRPERRAGASTASAHVVHITPLGELFPDEVRHVGDVLGVPAALLDA